MQLRLYRHPPVLEPDVTHVCASVVQVDSHADLKAVLSAQVHAEEEPTTQAGGRAVRSQDRELCSSAEGDRQSSYLLDWLN